MSKAQEISGQLAAAKAARAVAEMNQRQKEISSGDDKNNALFDVVEKSLRLVAAVLTLVTKALDTIADKAFGNSYREAYSKYIDDEITPEYLDAEISRLEKELEEEQNKERDNERAAESNNSNGSYYSGSQSSYQQKEEQDEAIEDEIEEEEQEQEEESKEEEKQEGGILDGIIETVGKFAIELGEFLDSLGLGKENDKDKEVDKNDFVGVTLEDDGGAGKGSMVDDPRLEALVQAQRDLDKVISSANEDEKKAEEENSKNPPVEVDNDKDNGASIC